jgi:hypothetical protein
VSRSFDPLLPLVVFLQVMDQAMLVGAPVIGLNDSGGARIQVTMPLKRFSPSPIPRQISWSVCTWRDILTYASLAPFRGRLVEQKLVCQIYDLGHTLL